MIMSNKANTESFELVCMLHDLCTKYFPFTLFSSKGEQTIAKHKPNNYFIDVQNLFYMVLGYSEVLSLDFYYWDRSGKTKYVDSFFFFNFKLVLNDSKIGSPALYPTYH